MIQFLGVNISPNPVEKGKTVKISTRVEDVFYMLCDSEGNPILDADGDYIYITMDELNGK